MKLLNTRPIIRDKDTFPVVPPRYLLDLILMAVTRASLWGDYTNFSDFFSETLLDLFTSNYCCGISEMNLFCWMFQDTRNNRDLMISNGILRRKHLIILNKLFFGSLLDFNFFIQKYVHIEFS